MISRADDEPRFALSATQVIASMAAAVLAALVGSRLGVAGTVIGAGLASVISVVGGAVVGHSILLTRNTVKKAVLQVRGVDDPPADDPPADDHTVVIPAVTRIDRDMAARHARQARLDQWAVMKTATPGGPERSEPGSPRPTRRKVGKRLLVGLAVTVAIFASSLAAVTVFETIKGSPLSGGESGGLSVLGGNSGGDADPNTIEAPATTVHVTVQATVTQAVTSEATVTSTANPTPTPTDSAPQSSSHGSVTLSTPPRSATAADSSAGAADGSASSTVPTTLGAATVGTGQ